MRVNDVHDFRSLRLVSFIVSRVLLDFAFVKQALDCGQFYCVFPNSGQPCGCLWVVGFAKGKNKTRGIIPLISQII